jgi:hypothetical protein
MIAICGRCRSPLSREFHGWFCRTVGCAYCGQQIAPLLVKP